MCIREDGQVLLHGDSHMATARLDHKEALVGPGWVPWLHELTRNKLLSHLVGILFSQRKVFGFRMGVC